MATQQEIKRIIEKINFDGLIVIKEDDLKKVLYQDKKREVKQSSTIQEFLLKNATIIDIQRLLLLIVKRLQDGLSETKKYQFKHQHNKEFATYLEEQQLKQAIDLAKEYIKEDDDVKFLETFPDKDEMYIITSKRCIYNEKENENLRYEEIKDYIPVIDKRGLEESFDMMYQMLNDYGISVAIYTVIVNDTLLKQGYNQQEMDDLFDDAGTFLGLQERAIPLMDPSIFHEKLKIHLGMKKDFIDADKYLLFTIHRINQKLEKQETLQEDEIKLIENLDELLKNAKMETKIVIHDEDTYGFQDVKKFLSKINLETGDYCTERQLRTGEKLLKDTNGYEDYLKKSTLRKLAQIDENISYLWKKRKINKNELADLLKTRELPDNVLIELYIDKGLSLSELEEFAYKRKANFEEWKQIIRNKKQVDVSSINYEDRETWELLTLEEKKQVVMLKLDDENSTILQQMDKEDLACIYSMQHLSELYKEIYIEGKVENQEEYTKLIKIHNALGNQENEEIISLLEDEFSNQMLINLYKDKVISMELLESYGEKELVIEAFQKGLLHEKDISRAIRKYPIPLTEEQIIQFYRQGVIFEQELIKLYFEDKIKIDTLKKLEVQLEKYLGQEELLSIYKKSKKDKNQIRYKKYNLLYQAFIGEKLKDEVIEKYRRGWKKEDIIQLYQDNLMSLDDILKYGNINLNDLLTEGIVKPSDAQEIFHKQAELVSIEEILSNPAMDSTQKIILIYSTYPEPSDKEKRDYLVEKYLQINEVKTRNEEKVDSKDRSSEKSKSNKGKQTITDPYQRWKLFSALDRDYTKTYLDGYLIVHLNNTQKTIIEKMYQKRKNAIEPSYGTATFILDTEDYIKIEKEIIKNEGFDIKVLRKMAKEHPEIISKITHHAASKDTKEKEKNSWGKRILTRILGNIDKGTIYSQEDMQEIEKCMKEIEDSRQELIREE